MPINKNEIIVHYDFFKKTAFKYLNNNEIDKSARYIELAARIGYKYNFRYTDDELENYIQQISKLIYNDNIRFTAIPNRIVFYDSFSNNRVLTQQYLRAIISWGSELIYITPQKSIGEDILDELTKNSNIKIIQISKTDSFEVNILNTVNAIKVFKPKYAFLHFSPWDIFGFSLWNIFNNVERFLINLTDHAFWLGKNCMDYCLEFRKHGCCLSHNYRNIPIEKLLMQPYYPIQSKTNFQGFPIDKGSKLIAFAGSTPYKIYGRNKLFLRIIKSILEQNSNLIFLFAGRGDLEPIKTFIKENKFDDRFFLIGDRKDIDQVIKNIDIYINTYPMIGGLMSQLAAINNKPIIGYTDLDLFSFNDAEDLLRTKSKGLLVKTNVNEFVNYFNQLLKDDEEKEKNIQATKNCVITPSQFSSLLYKNITTHEHIEPSYFHEVTIDINAICELYIDMENNFLNNHSITILRTLKKQIFLDNFSLGLKVLFNTIVKKINNRMNSIRHIPLSEL